MGGLSVELVEEAEKHGCIWSVGESLSFGRERKGLNLDFTTFPSAIYRLTVQVTTRQ